MKNNKIKIPYCCNNIFIPDQLCGKNLKRICEPSNGGMGTKLKIPSKRLYKTIMPNRDATADGKGTNLIMRPKNIASAKLLPGPARETFTVPHF